MKQKHTKDNKKRMHKKYNLVSSHNQFHSFWFKFPTYIAGTQGINPSKFSVLSFCLIELLEDFYTLNLQ